MIEIYPIPAFSDNYIWLLSDKASDTNSTIVIDPGDDAPVVDYIQKNNYSLDYILLTHHHFDHMGGVSKLLQAYPHCQVFSPGKNNFNFKSSALNEGDSVIIPELNITFDIWHIPGHTAGHISYYSQNQKIFFCGDTVFVNGCGRVFDGTIHQLYSSIKRISQLPPETKLYCAHEYTLDNIQFSLLIDSNDKMKQYLQHVSDLRKSNIPTVPTTVEKEHEYNLFFRCDEDLIINFCQAYSNHNLATEEEVFKTLRDYKDKEYD